mmetsp:Transcript_27570/g.53566  ORF Transcript_27570/g.53566 Transcript_27570/m.53566 type:complete len:97 (+) Transcript_27570:53-343(+)
MQSVTPVTELFSPDYTGDEEKKGGPTIKSPSLNGLLEDDGQDSNQNRRCVRARRAWICIVLILVMLAAVAFIGCHLRCGQHYDDLRLSACMCVSCA